MFVEQQRMKQKVSKLQDCVREKKDIAVVYLNRKERRRQACGGLRSQGTRKSTNIEILSKFSDTTDTVSCGHVIVEDSSKSAGYASSGSSSTSSDGSLDEREEGELETSESECSDDALNVDEIVGTEGI